MKTLIRLIASTAAAAAILTAPALGARTHAVHGRADLHTVGRQGRVLIQSGLITGTFRGHITAKIAFTPTGLLVSFTVNAPGGRFWGRSTARIRIHDGIAQFAGSATVSGGTGRFWDVRSHGMRLSGSAPSTMRSIVRIAGVMQY